MSDKCAAFRTTKYNEKSDTYVTPAGRITFAAIAKKYVDKNKEGDNGQYALNIVVPPKADLKLLKDRMTKTAKEKFGDKVRGLRSPFLDADEKLGDKLPDNDFKGWIMLRANTYQMRPGVIDANGVTVPEDELAAALYNGRWARMSVQVSAYDQPSNKGVKFYLQNIQLLDDDETLALGGGRTKPEDDFEAVANAEGGDQTADSIFGDS
jgi:hypothetical protein